MNRVRFWNPELAYQKIKDEVDAEMQRVLTAGDLILRKDVEEFEENFAKYVGTKYAIGVASGTDALILSLKALGVGRGDKVLVPSYTFRATAEAVHHAGATPVLEGSFDEVRAWIPAHIAGEVTATQEQFDEAKAKGVVVVEDAAQAIGATPVRGDTACYSFYPAKILGCYGDGGAIATDSEQLASTLKKLRNHNKDDWREYGYNSRLDNLQAAVLNVKLKYLPEAIRRRKEIASRYDNELQGVTLPTPRAIYQDYIIEHSDRDGLHAFLAENGIETMKNEYPFPADLQKDQKVAEYESRSLRLPCTPELTDDEQSYVIEQVNAYVAK